MRLMVINLIPGEWTALFPTNGADHIVVSGGVKRQPLPRYLVLTKQDSMEGTGDRRQGNYS